MSFKNSLGKKAILAAGWAAPLWDVLLAPLTIAGVLWFRVARYWGVKRLKVTRGIFLKMGLFPVVDHYYEPLFDYHRIPAKANAISHLDFNDAGQLALIGSFRYGAELLALPVHGTGFNERYYFNNGSFMSGDAELYYSIIRKNKPARILEVGSGFSTLISLQAIAQNILEDPQYTCAVTCVEPYEVPYLEKLPVRVIRNKVEDIDPAIFGNLKAGDILFIDSSHIIRPGGDVTYLILKILPILATGVWIHFHDIFLPAGYPISWLRDEFRMWNEQYLLEAFLIGNEDYEIISSLNYMRHKYPNEVSESFPVLRNDFAQEPGSFWIHKK